MKRFLITILIFFAVILALDFAFGLVCGYLNSHAKGGDTGNIYKITCEQTAPVLVMGSSRAVHHYNPKILEDSLGKEVYNCGVDGMGIIFQYGRLLLLLERYTPEMIVYDVCPPFDIAADDPTRYIKDLKRWKSSSLLDSLFNDVDKWENIKLRSNFYRYNTGFLQMLMDNIRPMQAVSYNGFKPNGGIVNYEPADTNPPAAVWDPLKYKYFTRFLDLCREKGIQVVVTYSPSYHIESSDELAEMTRLCRERAVPVIDYYAYRPISDNGQLFYDATHLNAEGADRFSRLAARRLVSLTDSLNIAGGR